MKGLIQRVDEASVTIGGELYSKIGKGLLVLLGVDKEDTIENVYKLADKILNLRIFEDENEKMNIKIYTRTRLFSNAIRPHRRFFRQKKQNRTPTPCPASHRGDRVSTVVVSGCARTRGNRGCVRLSARRWESGQFRFCFASFSLNLMYVLSIRLMSYGVMSSEMSRSVSSVSGSAINMRRTYRARRFSLARK